MKGYNTCEYATPPYQRWQNEIERFLILPFSARKHLFNRSGPVHFPPSGEPDSIFTARKCGEANESLPFPEPGPCDGVSQPAWLPDCRVSGHQCLNQRTDSVWFAAVNGVVGRCRHHGRLQRDHPEARQGWGEDIANGANLRWKSRFKGILRGNILLTLLSKPLCWLKF